jgi:hypothetical protein
MQAAPLFAVIPRQLCFLPQPGVRRKLDKRVKQR